MATLKGVQPSQVGTTYALALGFDPGTGVVNMVGYVLTPGSKFELATDINDEEHLVQVASPNQTDRFTRYPKVSQGDFSGGERQAIFADPTKYYSSYGLETSLPGELKLIGKYTTIAYPSSAGDMAIGAGAIEADAASFFVATKAGNTNNMFTVDQASLGINSYNYGGATAVTELVRGGNQIYLNVPAVGLFQQGSVNPGVAIVGQAAFAGTSGRCMAYFAGNLWYLISGVAQAPLYAITPPFPGPAGGGTAKDTIFVMEAQYDILGSSPTGLVLMSGYFSVGKYFVYTFNGATRTLVGMIEGIPIDIREAAGVTYILMQGSNANTPGQPIIYALSGNTLSVFDDYRTLPSDFQANIASTSGGMQGRLDTDGRHLFLAWGGMAVKRYSLANPLQATAVMDVGGPTTPYIGPGIHLVACSTPTGNIMETIPVAVGNNYVSVLQFNATPQAFASGDLGTSSYDFGTPTIPKAFRSVEVELRKPLPTGATVRIFQAIDNATSATELTPVLTLPNGNLLVNFPAGTKGYRVQVHLLLTANSSGAGPVVRSLSVNATLARVIKATVSCRRNQQTMELNPDPQALSAQSLIANIVNAHRQAAGKVTLYVPDPSDPTGVSTINATLEEYHQTVPAGVGPGLRRDDEGSADMEADVEILLTESV